MPSLINRRTVALTVATAALASAGLATAVPATASTTRIAAAADTSRAAGWPVLQRGSSGKNVQTLQYLLRCAANAPRPAADGIFGGGTETAVKAFQSRAGLSQDGAVGALTWGKLTNDTVFNATVSRKGPGQHMGNCVSGAQIQLTKHGHTAVPEPGDEFFGVFTEETHDAAVDFQGGVGLPSNGVVGPATWHKLISTGN